MNAIFKRELSSYFNSVGGYVFGAFLLLFAGIYSMVYNLQNALPDFSFVLSGMSFVFMVIIPVLTMRVLAEERRQKTDQLLYSLPLSMGKVVLGKYFAMLVVFLIPLLVISLYPLLLTAYGKVNLRSAYSAVTGFFFLGAALISIGMYVSSVTDSQPVAAGLCFVVMLANYFIADLASFVPPAAFASVVAFVALALVLSLILYLMTRNGFAALLTAAILSGGIFAVYLVKATLFEGLFPAVLRRLSLFEQFNGLINGIFDLRCLLYLASVSAIFLFLSVQSMEKRRWSE